jgi:signal transduction histidine kinase
MTLRTRKHAGTSSVSVLLDEVKGGVRLRVRDHGRGFNLSGSAEAPGRVGLAAMGERAELVKGRLTIQTAPGHGTTAQAWVPLAPGNQSRLP